MLRPSEAQRQPDICNRAVALLLHTAKDEPRVCNKAKRPTKLGLGCVDSGGGGESHMTLDGWTAGERNT